MIRKEGDSPFAAFGYLDHPQGVAGYHAEAEQESEARRLATKQARQATFDNDPRMHDPEAVNMAAEEGITWGQFVLECLRIRPVTEGAPTMRTISKKEAYQMTDRLGFDSSVLDEPMQCGVASYDRLPRRWIEVESPEQLGAGLQTPQPGYIGPLMTIRAGLVSVSR